MKPLLRLQAVLLARMLAMPVVAIILATLLAAACLAPTMEFADWGLASVGASLALLGLAPAVLTLMVFVLAGVNAVRWVSPVRPVQVLAAHVLFWTAVCALPAAAITACRAAMGAHDSMFVLANLVLLGAYGAAVTPVIQRLSSHSRRRDLALAIVVVGFTAAPAMSGAAMAWHGEGSRGAVMLVVVLCVGATASLLSFVRDQCLPSASSTPVVRAPSAPGRASRTRTPTVSMLRATWPTQWAVLWVGMGILWLVLPGLDDATQVVWMLIPVSSLSTLALSSWRWLVATPIDRGRAFRTMFLPLVIFAVVAATTRTLLREQESNRTSFFDRDGHARFHGRLRNLTEGDFLSVDADGHVARFPKLPVMAERVRDHLRARFGLRISEPRISEILGRVWTEPPQVWNVSQSVSWAMDRVRADLAPEILAADRTRAIVRGLAAVLISLLIVRLQLFGFRPKSRALLVCGWGSVIAIVFLPSFAPSTSAAAWVNSACELVYAAFQHTPSPVPALLVLASAAVAWLLWRSSFRAFRRLDVTDLPPSMGAWGMPRRRGA